MALLVGIVGFGFVGKAIWWTLRDTNSVTVYDKYHPEYKSTVGLKDCDICYIAVPTAFSTEIGGYDLSAVRDVLCLLKEIGFNGIILLKSTVAPGTVDHLVEETGLRIYYNPEFLTARTAIADFQKQRHIVIGYPKKYDILDLEKIKRFYHSIFIGLELSIVKAVEAEAMKIFCNSFYATKVQIFTEFHEHCKTIGASYPQVVDLMLKNGWINPMHTQVPGPDGVISFGGACLTKDLSALVMQMSETETPCMVLQSAIQERNLMRDD